MNKISGVLALLIAPVLMCAQNNAPASWRTIKTCPQTAIIQNEFYKTLKFPQQFKDTRYLAEKCHADITADALYPAVLSGNYPATKYLFSKIKANPAELLTLLNLEVSSTPPADETAEKNLSKICNFLADKIIQQRQILRQELYDTARLDFKAFKKLYKHAHKYALQSPVQLSNSVMKECVIWRAEAQINNRQLTLFTDKNMQQSCSFALKHEPETTPRTLQYIFLFQPELVNDYLNENTAAWLLALAAQIAPEQYWQRLEDLETRASPDALLSPDVRSAKQAEFLLRLGAQPSEMALARFIEEDNTYSFATQLGYIFDDSAAPYQIIQLLLESGADPNAAGYPLLNKAMSPDTKKLLKKYGAKTADQLLQK